ncbi:MAG: Gfo/Idh/MocA family oxidoreductase [Planctomycetaceae bacterium]|nr:Gfo/Idh/MocA family oxidoreductase [Planctomycetaceae bacterium]
MLRLGLVDFDTSHVVEFSQRFNQTHVASDQHVTGARVVAGIPGSSVMAPERIAGFQPQVEACGVEIVNTPDELLQRVDAVLINSLCGAAHLKSARPFLEAGVPTFVDKPFANSWEDALALVELARKHHAFLWHASALRYTQEMQTLQSRLEKIGPLHGAVSYGPAWHADGNPGLLHYGIHSTEQLFALMGPGCVSVVNMSTAQSDAVVGTWKDGRQGVVRGGRCGHTAYGILAFTEHGVLNELVSTKYAYRNLCQAIADAFQSKQAPVELDETLEVIRFLLAANESAKRDGSPVLLEEIGNTK